MKRWWESISARERRLVMGMAAALLLALVWWGLIAPFRAQHVEAERQLHQQRETLAWMLQHAGEVQAVRPAGPAPDRSLTLEAVVNQTARQAGITLTRLQPLDKQLQVEPGVMEFDRLVNWLARMERDYAVQATLLELVAEDGKGRVRVRRLQVGRAG